MTLLVRDADWCATFDDDDTELAHADVLVDDGMIAAVGVDLAVDADRVIDGRGLVLLPGLVNSHQHLYQGACRAIPHLELALIGPWLAGLGALVKGWWRVGREYSLPYCPKPSRVRERARDGASECDGLESA